MPAILSLLEGNVFLEHSREVESCKVWQRHVLSWPRFLFLRKGLEPYVTVLDTETLDSFYVSQMRKYSLLLYLFLWTYFIFYLRSV